jgi:hypothetical protein
MVARRPQNHFRHWWSCHGKRLVRRLPQGHWRPRNMERDFRNSRGGAGNNAFPSFSPVLREVPKCCAPDKSMQREASASLCLCFWGDS